MASIQSAVPEAPPWRSMKGKLHDGLLRGLESMGYSSMTPVQHKVLTELPSFHSDCLVQAKTGTGKTIAFLLPTLHQLLTTKPALRSGQVAILCISPTRELALQIAKECSSVTSQLRPPPECHTAYGGTSKDRELKKFLNGDPKILVATPGRLNDYLSDPAVANRFANLQTLILDEADQMLEAGFLPDIQKILRHLPPKSKSWQGMCFSATMPKSIQGVLPNVLSPDATHISTVDPDETPTIDRVTQHSIIVPTIADVHVALLGLLQKEYELSPNDFKVIVFGTTANGVNLMHALFAQILRGRQNQMQVFQLQSRLSQNVRTRTTNEFKAASAGIMFASDVIGRGMDFPNVSLVLQVGVPSSAEQYVHRVGRTARAGNDGRAVIILTTRESFFLAKNKHLPITPYPGDVLSAANANSQSIATALGEVDQGDKTKAYQAWLGYHNGLKKPLQLNNEGLVAHANEYAAALGCTSPPPLERKTIGKMGLKGVSGLNIAQGGVDSAPRRPAGASRGRGGQRGLLNSHSALPSRNEDIATQKHGESSAGKDLRRNAGVQKRGRGRGRG